MQSEEMSFQSAFERGQHLGCSDVHRKVMWGGARCPEVAEVWQVCRVR